METLLDTRYSLFGPDCLGSLHSKGKENCCNDHYERLHNIEVIHVDIVAEHIVIAGNVGGLVAPGELCSNYEQDRPAT